MTSSSSLFSAPERKLSGVVGDGFQAIYPYDATDMDEPIQDNTLSWTASGVGSSSSSGATDAPFSSSSFTDDVRSPPPAPSTLSSSSLSSSSLFQTNLGPPSETEQYNTYNYSPIFTRTQPGTRSTFSVTDERRDITPDKKTAVLPSAEPRRRVGFAAEDQTATARDIRPPPPLRALPTCGACSKPPVYPASSASSSSTSASSSSSTATIIIIVAGIVLLVLLLWFIFKNH
jgi:hypothetical protein